MLKDVATLVRRKLVAAPSGFTKQGHPILYLPDLAAETGGIDPVTSIPDSDLLNLLRYYLSVVPRTAAEQQPSTSSPPLSSSPSGVALLVDRRMASDWSSVRALFLKVVGIFPARYVQHCT